MATFFILGQLFGGQLFWVICPWNEFEETKQCATEATEVIEAVEVIEAAEVPGGREIIQ